MDENLNSSTEQGAVNSSADASQSDSGQATTSPQDTFGSTQKNDAPSSTQIDPKVLENVVSNVLKQRGIPSAQDIQRLVQSNVDRRMASVNKRLAERFAVLDELVREGSLDKSEAERQKQKMVVDQLVKSSELSEQADAGVNWNRLALDYAQRFGLSLNDLPEVAEYNRIYGHPIPFDQFVSLVNERVLRKMQAQALQEAQRQLEQKQSALREAEKKGAAKPTPVGRGGEQDISNITDPKTLYRLALSKKR